jgi:outer membrane immunogenic protein
MKKLLFIGVALSAIAGPAGAADLGRQAPVYKAAPVMAVAPMSWSGCYVGGNVGGVWGTKDWNVTGSGAPIGSHDVSSVIGGVQAGCDVQTGAVVFGIQGDYDWTGANGSNADLVIPGDTDRTQVKSLASVTGRLGYAWGQFLGYVKGGGAWVRDDYDVFVTATGAPAASASETRGGWTAGLGGELALNRNWSAFIEYDHYGFGTRANAFVTPTGATFGSADIKQDIDVVKGGINYRVNWGR